MTNKNNLYFFLLYFIFVSLIVVSGCSSSKTDDKEENEYDETEKYDQEELTSSAILKTAAEEQKNKMYSVSVDSTYLYWLDSRLIILNGSTKCNIYALNVLKRSGCMTPEVNALSRDLYDTNNFRDILPVVGVNDISNAKAGDLIVWNGHVIIFESELEIGGQKYARAYWAGTNSEDNGDNIINNVCHGKFKLNGDFIVRRPRKKSTFPG
ncbi:MAG: hypothetical protein JSS91_04650 [Bacteroidetes bacterium]|nr:hypothetical protein [Bacteroidota bacterium]